MQNFLSHRDIKAVVAELIGTFMLGLLIGVVAVGADIYQGLYQGLFLPFIIGMLIMVLVYLFGQVSGAHFNPAVTVGMLFIRKITLVHAGLYIVAQIAGAFLGLRMAELLVGTTPDLTFAVGGPAMWGEFLGAALLVLAVTAATIGKVPSAINGLFIGSALTVGMALSLVPSGGLINPAISLSLQAFHLSYLLAPILGGIVGAVLGQWLLQEKDSLTTNESDNF